MQERLLSAEVVGGACRTGGEFVRGGRNLSATGAVKSSADYVIRTGGEETARSDSDRLLHTGGRAGVSSGANSMFRRGLGQAGVLH